MYNYVYNLKLTTMSDVVKEVYNPEKSRKAKPAKAVNLTNNKVLYYKSIHSAGKSLGISPALVKNICDELSSHKTGTSKKDGYKYTFKNISDYEYQRRMADKHDDKIVVRINTQDIY